MDTTQSAFSSPKGLESILNPRSIAIAGISVSRPDSYTRDFLSALLEFEFPGPIYLVNPKGGEIFGLRVYPSMKEIPGPVDYVISSVPAERAAGLIKDCAYKQVKVIHFYTAGFSETGETAGKNYEADIVAAARETGIRIVGPNCMGIYAPKSRLSFMANFPKESGPVGLICQSGGNTVDLINQTRYRGIRFSKVISFGNACDLNETDYLNYLADDPDTGIIGLYLEGIKGGKDFRPAWDKAVRQKTVILLKAGSTEAGARATVSHTASLAGNDVIWETLCRQSGAIRVRSLPEMADMIVTAQLMRPFAGNRVAVIGAGGGASVLMADELEQAGFRLPPLPDEVKRRILEFTPQAGFILRNPIDYIRADTQARATKILSEWEDIDFIIAFLRTSFFRITEHQNYRQRWREKAYGFLEAAAAATKPMAMILEPGVLPQEAEMVFRLTQQFIAAGVPVYNTFKAAVQALRLYANHHADRSKGVYLNYNL